MSENVSPDITTLTVQLLSAFVSNNSVPVESLAELIRTTRDALTEDPGADAAAASAVTYTPAVSVRKSLSSPDHILSMIDGRPYKTLKRHLATHGLSPDEYRQRYDLPKSYPLVAPSYSEARRAVATRLGLGKKPVSPATKPAADKAPAAAAKPAPAAKPAAPKAAAPKAATAKPAAVKPAAEKPAAAKTEAAKTEAAKPAAQPAAAAKQPATDKAPAKAKAAPASSAAKAPAKAKAKPKLSIKTPKAEPAATAKPDAAAPAKPKAKAPTSPAEPAA